MGPQFSSRGDQAPRETTVVTILEVSTLLPLSRKVLSDHTELVLEVLKFPTRQRLGQHICYLFIYANVLNLDISFMHQVMYVEVSNFYVP